MTRRPQIILQCPDQARPEELDRARQLSKARYTRLTANGPLKFYRNELLKETDRAYKLLSQPDGVLKHKPLSLLARQVKQSGGTVESLKPGVKSSVKTTNLFADRPKSSQPQTENAISKKEMAFIEDEFCKEVLFRLEGDLIRFSSRRELLNIASDKGIHLFRANLLMAQIVESVRQHKLYEPSEEEKNILAQPKETYHKYQGKSGSKKRAAKIYRSNSKLKFNYILLSLAALLFLLIDFLIIKSFMR